MNYRSIGLFIILTMVGALPSRSQTIGAGINGYVGPWGPGSGTGRIFGESFTAPATGSPVLSAFSFNDPVFESNNSLGWDYVTEIYAFDPTSAMTAGGALYTGPMATVPGSGTSGDSLTPDLALTPGATYIAFATPNGLTQANPTADGAFGVFNPPSYSGGEVYYADTAGGTAYDTYTWNGIPFNATFSATFVDNAATPEPSTWALLLADLGALAFWRMRLRRA